MAWYNGNRRYRRRKKRYSKAKKLNALAYNMGRVNAGLQGDTQVAASYKKGAAAAKKSKKPLF